MSEFLWLALIPVMNAGIVFLLLLYRVWKVIQWEGCRVQPGSLRGMRITPGRAVGFLFVPIWSLGWVVPVIAGWARNHNVYVTRFRGSLPRVPERLFWVGLVLVYVSGVLRVLGQRLPGLLLPAAYVDLAAFPVWAAIVAGMQSAFNLLRRAEVVQVTGEGPEAICRQCGARLSHADIFCPSCGTKVPRHWRACGRELRQGARYCPFCGTAIGEPGTSAAVRDMQLAATSTVLQENAEEVL